MIDFSGSISKFKFQNLGYICVRVCVCARTHEVYPKKAMISQKVSSLAHKSLLETEYDLNMYD